MSQSVTPPGVQFARVALRVNSFLIVLVAIVGLLASVSNQNTAPYIVGLVAAVSVGVLEVSISHLLRLGHGWEEVIAMVLQAIWAGASICDLVAVSSDVPLFYGDGCSTHCSRNHHCLQMELAVFEAEPHRGRWA